MCVDNMPFLHPERAGSSPIMQRILFVVFPLIAVSRCQTELNKDDGIECNTVFNSEIGVEKVDPDYPVIVNNSITMSEDEFGSGRKYELTIEFCCAFQRRCEYIQPSKLNCEGDCMPKVEEAKVHRFRVLEILRIRESYHNSFFISLICAGCAVQALK